MVTSLSRVYKVGNRHSGQDCLRVTLCGSTGETEGGVEAGAEEKSKGTEKKEGGWEKEGTAGIKVSGKARPQRRVRYPNGGAGALGHTCV
jgi:hypothetical protein